MKERDKLGDLGEDGRGNSTNGMWGMDWIELAQHRDRWRALVNAIMNSGFHKMHVVYPSSLTQVNHNVFQCLREVNYHIITFLGRGDARKECRIITETS
jgi:hypothetical protein